MAGTSNKTEQIGIRVPVEVAAEWRKIAEAREMKFSAYVSERAMRQDTPLGPGVDMGALKAKLLAELRADPTMASTVVKASSKPIPRPVEIFSGERIVAALDIPIMLAAPKRDAMKQSMKPKGSKT